MKKTIRYIVMVLGIFSLVFVAFFGVMIAVITNQPKAMVIALLITSLLSTAGYAMAIALAQKHLEEQ